MTDFEIISVAKHRLPECVQTLHTAFGEMAARFGYTKETYPASGAYITLDELAQALDAGTHMYAAVIDGMIAGYVQLQKLSPAHYAFRRFAVLPEYRGLGIGRALIGHCKARAESFGAESISLVMINQNTVLKKLYEDSGFKSVRTFNDSSCPLECAEMVLYLK